MIRRDSQEGLTKIFHENCDRIQKYGPSLIFFDQSLLLRIVDNICTYISSGLSNVWTSSAKIMITSTAAQKNLDQLSIIWPLRLTFMSRFLPYDLLYWLADTASRHCQLLSSYWWLKKKRLSLAQNSCLIRLFWTNYVLPRLQKKAGRLWRRIKNRRRQIR